MRTILVLLIINLFTSQAGAQKIYDTTTAKLFDEFTNIQYALTVHDDSFSVKTIAIGYYLEDNKDSVTVYSNYSASYSISADRYKLTRGPSDSFAIIQNDKYQVTFYKNDSTVVIQKPVAFEKLILQVDVMDSLFQNVAMKSMTSADSGVSYRKITINFENEAPFASYEIMYKQFSYEILYIKYAIKNQLNNKTNKLLKVYMTFSEPTFLEELPGYDVFFSTDNYIQPISPVEIQTSTLTENFEVINLINN